MSEGLVDQSHQLPERPTNRAMVEESLEAYIRLLSALTDYTSETGLYLSVLSVFCALSPAERDTLEHFALRCFQARQAARLA